MNLKPKDRQMPRLSIYWYDRASFESAVDYSVSYSQSSVFTIDSAEHAKVVEKVLRSKTKLTTLDGHQRTFAIFM